MIPPLCAVFTPWFHCICNFTFVGHVSSIFIFRVFGQFWVDFPRLDPCFRACFYQQRLMPFVFPRCSCSSQAPTSLPPHYIRGRFWIDSVRCCNCQAQLVAAETRSPVIERENTKEYKGLVQLRQQFGVDLRGLWQAAVRLGMRNIRVYLYIQPFGDRQIPFRGLRTKPYHQCGGSGVLCEGIVSSLDSSAT